MSYIKKGQDARVEDYSAFADNQYHRFTTLDPEVEAFKIKTIFIVGMLTEACVKYTSIDGIKLGYEVIVIEDAVTSFLPEDKQRDLEEVRGWGVQVMKLREFEDKYSPGRKRANGKEQ